MRIKVPILDTTGETVAQFVWDGTFYEGQGWFEQVAATPEQMCAARGVIEINRYLRGVDFLSIGDREYVKGWFGLEGNVSALRLTLPTVGLSVGRFDPSDAIIEVVDNTQQKESYSDKVIE